MTVLADLFAEAPCAGWLAIACLLLAAEAASGRSRLTWPAVAAVGPALLGGLHAPGGLWTQLGAFIGLSLAAKLIFAREQRALRAAAPRPTPAHGLPTPTAGRETKTPARLRRERPRTARLSPEPGSGRKARAKRPVSPQGRASRASAVVGTRGRTLGEFCNGVGRVWIDRAEWAAELIQGDALAPDRDVEVVGVSGGVRLRVRAVA